MLFRSIRVAAGDPSYQIKTNEFGIEAVRIPAFPAIKTDERGRVWIGWNNKFQSMDATEIDDRVKDKIVILCITIEGIVSIIATPVGEKLAGDVQAQALQTMVDGTSISRSSESRILEGTVLTILLLLCLYIVPRLSVVLTVPFLVAFVAGLSYGSYYLFKIGRAHV